MKYLRQIVLILTLMFAVAVPGHATVLVNDVWNFSSRSYPAYNNPNSPYSEMGFDYNFSGDFESAWFSSSSAALTVPAAGDLRAVQPTTSLSLTTYFTPEGSEVNLANAGDELKITWVFTPTTVSSANTIQGLPLAVVNTPSGSRLTSDNSPPSAAYAGYAMFMNISQTLGGSTPFQLKEWSVASGNLLSSSSSWTTALANGVASGVHGFDSGTQYTFTMTMTHNALNGLDITATMTGGTYNTTGNGTVSFTDSTPNSFLYDTFAIRPTGSASTAAQWDTSLFKVEFIPVATPPAIESDPVDQAVLAGQDATFNVIASGTAPLSYQWYYNTNTLLTNAIGSSVTVTNAQLSDMGGYLVVVSNSFNSVTSAVAQLTVSTPVAPSITTQPQDQTNILPGATATFSVVAGGSEPLSYQWYYNTNTLLANATDSILTITNIQPGNAGNYSVTVSNIAGGVVSSNAFLTVNTSPVAPVFNSQPASLVVLAGSTVSFTAVAAGTAPISYQWNKNSAPIPGATSSTLTLTNVQVAADGSYTLTASNSVGSVTSDLAQLTVTLSVPVVNSAYNLTGFGRLTTGGGVIPETDPAYRKVTNALDLANAILSAYKTAGSVKVIEIMTNLDLGWNEVGSAVQTLASTPFRSHNTPQLHPRLLITGVSLIDIKPKSGLTIFSANGSTIRHACFNIKSTANIIVRNLKFDEMWEWDEATKGQYDQNDWDFIDLGNGGAVSNIWVDHCTFTKTYDGILDTKAGSSAITLSWCKYVGDDGATNTNSFVWQQINALEASLASGTNKMYTFLRTHGFSTTDIVTIIQGHDKTHLAGQNDLKPDNATISMTFHHLWLNSVWDRCVPRLRGGNVHDYNIYVDDTLVLAAKRLRDTRATAMSTANQNTLNNTYSFRPPINGSISTENGAILVEKSVYIDCLTPLRNNQTDPSNPQYTGKIKALDTIYQMDSTTIRGNSTDPGNPLGPFQAPVIAFSWNLPANQLPYSYNMDDPSQLQAIITNPTAGAGAGVLTWAKTNWLITSYASTAPIIVADPQSQTITTGQGATFTVAAGGSTPLSYQWYFNTNTLLANATNAFLTLINIQATNAGTYSVTVSNVVGSVTSTNALLMVSAGTPAKPQLSSFGYDNGTFSLTVNGDTGPDYIVQASTNLTDWASIFTNHSPTPPFVWTDSAASNFSQRFYRIRLGP